MNHPTIRERLEGIPREDVSLHKENGGECNGVPAYFVYDSGNLTVVISCDQISQAVEEGDVLIRYWLPHGGSERLLVLEPGLTRATNKGQPPGFPQHYVIQVARERRDKVQIGLGANIFNLNGPNSRINISSTDHSLNS